MLGRGQRALREQGGRQGLTASQSEALGYLFRDGPLTITALAKRARVRSQSMGATVKVLLDRGLVAASPDAADGRHKVIAVTAAGRNLIAQGRTTRTDWLAKQLEALTPAERATLAKAQRLLDRIFT